MDDATLLVLPSWPEGLGRVIIEAFARGRGVVATEAGGIPDLVTHEREGLLIPPADVTALTEALERVLTDRELAGTPRRRRPRALRRLALDARGTRGQAAAARRGDRGGHRRADAAPRSSRRRSTPTTPPSRRRSTSSARSPAASRRSASCAARSVATTCRRMSSSRPSTRAPASGEACASRGRRAARSRAAPTPRSSTWCRSSSSCSRPSRRRDACRSCSGTRTGTPDRSLRAATRLADVVLSVDRRSFPLETAKLHATGHAIDVERFTPGGDGRRDGRLRLLSLGRMARWKGHATTLEGLRLAVEAGLDAELELRGPALTDDELAHRAELERTVAEAPELASRVRIEPPVAREEIPAALRAADALVSATQPRGSETLDKVVYEAAVVRCSRRREQRRAAGVPRRPPGGAELPAGRCGGPRPHPRRSRRGGPGCAALDRPRAAPPRGRAALARGVGRRGRGGRGPQKPQVTSSTWRRRLRSRR